MGQRGCALSTDHRPRGAAQWPLTWGRAPCRFFFSSFSSAVSFNLTNQFNLCISWFICSWSFFLGFRQRRMKLTYTFYLRNKRMGLSLNASPQETLFCLFLDSWNHLYFLHGIVILYVFGCSFFFFFLFHQVFFQWLLHTRDHYLSKYALWIK